MSGRFADVVASAAPACSRCVCCLYLIAPGEGPGRMPSTLQELLHLLSTATPSTSLQPFWPCCHSGLAAPLCSNCARTVLPASAAPPLHYTTMAQNPLCAFFSPETKKQRRQTAPWRQTETTWVQTPIADACGRPDAPMMGWT
ncbi:hypothetical protein AOQ84DRAFT_220604 [Glonium stellatum]|uniref:Uncharacterized protein n=1 Tax=Glonium stellatum TaxID=574774 RepID=A0A8E2F2X5_9PEZI|nr:hypothetical protein AOQ84DRAFT_220604 [Glonium stellatum]